MKEHFYKRSFFWIQRDILVKKIVWPLLKVQVPIIKLCDCDYSSGTLEVWSDL